MSEYVIARFNSNWADEFGIESYSILEKPEFEKLKAYLKTIKTPITKCFGTNEEIEFENGQEVLDSIELEDISEDRARVICDTIGDSFGLVTLEDVYENIGDDLEELDENSEASSDIVFGMIPVEHPTLLTVYKVSPNKIILHGNRSRLD